MKKVNKKNTVDLQFPVVGIGASAGGLDAIRKFLMALPARSGMTFVFIQHLSPRHESILPEILQKVAPFPVRQITDNVHLEQDHLYIIPENKVVTTVDGMLKLAPLDKDNKKSNTIDLFFSSLGIVHQSYAVGIILSGALNDGTTGLQVIKSYGGLTFAQDERSAAFDSMPKSAIQAGVVDFVLPPEKIAEHLVSINLPFNANYSSLAIIDPATEQNNETFKQLLTVLRVRRGVDFTCYKQSTLKRRIIRRMALNKIEKPADYLGFLRENKVEQDALYNDMLISVTHFFRDAQSFEALCTTIFPALLIKKADKESLRIWVAGCATGEEAYSIAICLQEQLGDKATAMKIQIFATDVSEIAIAKARTGLYRSTELEGISPSRLQQFFTKHDDSYQVDKIIRDMCVFAHHNLLKDPPFSKIDLVSCRNVLIYLEPVLQKRALTTFNYALNEGGYLMLGKSETIGANTDIFAAHNSTEKIYIRKGPLGRFMSVASYGKEQTLRELDKNIQKESINKDVFKVADEAMLASFMPPAVLINEKFDIIQFRGSTETWLVSPSGKPSFNLLQMAREGLSFELRNILHQAKKTNQPAWKAAVFFKVNGLQHFVNITAMPLKDTMEPYYLVIFNNTSSTGVRHLSNELNTTQENTGYDENDQRIEQLEKELIQVRADMRAITEDQESANEELQSANEELLSGSEELQSLNEELETSKEELQSTNEEIMIVNNELLDRNNQLNNARIYTEGIVQTIRDPLIVLDRELRVKRATNGFYKKFRMNEKETEGKYIYELGDHVWDITRLRVLLEDILPAKKEIKDFEVEQVFPLIGKRIMRLNARKIDHINGELLILLAIEDITDKRKIEQGLAEVELLLNESKERLKFAIDAAGLGIWDYSPQTKEMIWDKRCKEIFGLSSSSSADVSSLLKKIHPDDRSRVENSIRETLSDKNSGEFDTEFKTIAINKKNKWLKAKGRAYFNEYGEAVRFIGTLLDNTVQKLVDEATRELLSKKDEFISIASHELKTPVTNLKAMLQIIERATLHKEEMKPMHAFIQKANKQIDKLTELIKDLLDVTKIQLGKLELKRTKFIIGELIEECRESLQDNAKKHRIILEGETDTEIFADRNRLEQVIVNLITNAIKYSPESDKIIIQVQKLSNGLKIAITDFGIGISADKIPLLFDRFYRVDENSQRYAGLGLFISAEIVKHHHGRIQVESEEGKGSTFWFILPK